MNDSVLDEGRVQTSAPARARDIGLIRSRMRGSDEVNLRELFDLVWSGRWVVALALCAFVSMGVVYALTAPPVFSASGIVQVEEDDKSISSSLDSLTTLLGGGSVQTPAEIAILNSRMVLSEVANRLNLRVVSSPHSFPLIGAVILRHRAKLDAPASAPFGLRSFAWGGESVKIGTFDVPIQFQDLPFVLTKTSDGFELSDQEGIKILEGKVGILATGEYKENPVRIFIQDFVAAPRTEFDLTLKSEQAMYAYMQLRLSVSEQPKDSGIIQIGYQGTNASQVAAIVTEIENVYLRQNIERRSEEAQQSLAFLQKQLPDIKEKVDNAQAALNAYQAKEGSADVQKETEIVLDQAVNLESQRLSLVQQREVALQRFTAKHPAVKALDEQIKSIDDALAKLHKQVENLPARQQEIFSLMRDLDVNSQLYTALLNSSQQLQITKAGTVGDVRIIDTALVPNLPSKPKKSLIVFASGLLGLIAGIGTVLMQRALMRGVDRPEDLESALGLPTYASIPYSRQQRKLADEMRRRRISNGILASLDAADLAVEALRSLRTSLHFAMLEASNNIVMLTSPAPNIGKSFISVNLGAVLALAGKKVVVVDGDLRRGRLHDYLGGHSAPGVSEFVAGLSGDEGFVRKTVIPGLDLIARGAAPPNPAEILMNPKFTDLLAELSRNYDYVIVDTPPVLAVADPMIIGRLAGTTFVVLKSAEHPLRMVEETIRRLLNAGVEVRGILFNQVGARVGSYGYGDYGYSYGYGSYTYRSTKD